MSVSKILNFSMDEQATTLVRISQIQTNIAASIGRGGSPSSGHLRFFVDKLKEYVLFIFYFALIIS